MIPFKLPSPLLMTYKQEECILQITQDAWYKSSQVIPVISSYPDNADLDQHIGDLYPAIVG